MKVQLSQKQIATFLLAVALPAFSSVVLASSTHGSSGHGAIKKMQSHGSSGHRGAKKMESQGHDEGGHGHSEIDYSKVEEHSFGKASDPEHAEKNPYRPARQTPLQPGRCACEARRDRALRRDEQRQAEARDGA